MNDQQDTRETVKQAYEAWRDAPYGNRRAEATHYQQLARQQERNDEVCSCGAGWREHFPVGTLGCDFFETKDEVEAELAVTA